MWNFKQTCLLISESSLYSTSKSWFSEKGKRAFLDISAACLLSRLSSEDLFFKNSNFGTFEYFFNLRTPNFKGFGIINKVRN